MKKTIFAITLAATMTASFWASAQSNVYTRVTYQGNLKDDFSGTSPVDGHYDFRYGVVVGQLDPDNPWRTNCPTCMTVFLATNSINVSQGLFTSTLMMPTGMLHAVAMDGTNVFFEFAFRTNGGGAFTTLTPLLPLSATPYAVVAQSVSGPLSASSLVGPVPPDAIAGTYANALKLSNPGNVLAGDGTLLANVNASTLGGFGPCNLPCYWNLLGNAATDPSVNFLGTTDNKTVVFRANKDVVMRYQPHAGGPDIIGGDPANYIDSGAGSAVIAGGGSTTLPNKIYNDHSAIGGGVINTIYGRESVIGGGWGNTDGFPNDGNGSHCAVIGGGSNNLVAVDFTFVGGGMNNSAVGTSAAVAGGEGNYASGQQSIIGGGSNNYVYADFGFIGGGVNNYVSGIGSAIAGGSGNTALRTYEVICGGVSNSVFGEESVIVGGHGNHIEDQRNFIGGGLGNSIDRSGGMPFPLFNVIGGGVSNINSGSFSTIGGGGYNIIRLSTYGESATIAGGGQNLANGNWAAIGGGAGNTAGPIGFVGGGWGNFATGNGSVVAGGTNNTASGAGAAIPGGQNNAAYGYLSAIGGGVGNINTANYTTIGGGFGNHADGQDAVVAGGSQNSATSNQSAVGGGIGNTTSGTASTVAGGQQNIASNNWASVGGGIGNVAGGQNSTVGGGNANQATGQDAVVSGGSGNKALGGQTTVSGGIANTASGTASTVLGGQQNSATNDFSVASGLGGITRTALAQVTGAMFVTPGDAQCVQYILRGQTSNTTPSFLAGPAVPISGAMSFTALVCAKAFGNASGGYEIKGMIRNYGGAVSFVGTPTVTILGEDVASLDAVPVISGNVLGLQVTGILGTTVHWLATLRTSEVVY